ncbi:hypothetical protein BGZ65_001450 [Modicella reniformis]|uniref:Uncharacterized protein n=1 Tax=Modicella reniformis TaxID=1440133 RepID=A0A9P6MA04_9FUNG|nr:hypothetical protein BGZ65_001450 [Modicella reniformis]
MSTRFSVTLPTTDAMFALDFISTDGYNSKVSSSATTITATTMTAITTTVTSITTAFPTTTSSTPNGSDDNSNHSTDGDADFLTSGGYIYVIMVLSLVTAVVYFSRIILAKRRRDGRMDLEEHNSEGI